MLLSPKTWAINAFVCGRIQSDVPHPPIDDTCVLTGGRCPTTDLVDANSNVNDRNPKRRAPEVSGLLERGRACFERREWNDAFAALSAADQSTPLGAEDLHRLAWSAGLTARDEEMLATQERLYHAHLEAGEGLAAARAAFWLGFRLLARGEAGRAGGWLGRAQRLVEREGRDCVEQGYLLLPVGQKHLSAGELARSARCRRPRRGVR